MPAPNLPTGLTATQTTVVEKPRTAVWPVDDKDVAVTFGEDGHTVQLVATVDVLEALLNDALGAVAAIASQNRPEDRRS